LAWAWVEEIGAPAGLSVNHALSPQAASTCNGGTASAFLQQLLVHHQAPPVACSPKPWTTR
jgi:hypothetical protein